MINEIFLMLLFNFVNKKDIKSKHLGNTKSKNFRGGPLPREKGKRMKMSLKNEGKGLKNATFWVINFKNFRGEKEKE